MKAHSTNRQSVKGSGADVGVERRNIAQFWPIWCEAVVRWVRRGSRVGGLIAVLGTSPTKTPLGRSKGRNYEQFPDNITLMYRCIRVIHRRIRVIRRCIGVILRRIRAIHRCIGVIHRRMRVMHRCIGAMCRSIGTNFRRSDTYKFRTDLFQSRIACA